MNGGERRRQAATHNRGGDRPSRVPGRPDRIALWAVFIALAATVAAAASSQAGTGGTGTSTPDECRDTGFGERVLRRGDCGDDVKTLNWVLRSQRHARKVSLSKRFSDPTHGAVRKFQRRKGLGKDGVVDGRTHRTLKRTMRRKTASWYGPGFWGNRTACGKKLKRKTVGVAHRKLPCGTKVTFNKGGRWLRTRVIDRGPYVGGRTWDLTRKAARQLGMTHTETVRSAVLRGGGRGAK